MSVLQLSSPGIILAILILTAVGIVIIAILMLRQRIRDKKLGIPPQDERTRLIMGRASTYALIFSIYFMLGIFWIIFIGVQTSVIEDPGSIPVLILSTVVMLASYFVFYVYFNKKGDK